MADTLTATPPRLGFVRIDNIRTAHKNVLTKQLAIAGTPAFEGTADIAIVEESVDWLTVPETCEDGVAFDVEIDPDALPRITEFKPLDRTATIRISKSGYDDLDVVVALQTKPGA